MSLLFARWKGEGPGRTRQGDRNRSGRHRRALSLEVMEARTLMTGTITPLAQSVPNGSGTMLLETNGDVIMVAGGDSEDNRYYVLAPDSKGSYVNGTWTQAASAQVARLFNGTTILPNGQMMVMGGEYSGPVGQGVDAFTNEGEIYTPSTNTWSSVAPYPMPQFGDDTLITLADGTVLGTYLGGTENFIYHPTTNTWTPTGSKLNNDQSDEETFVKLPDGSLLAYSIFSSINDNKGEAQRYIPSTGTWVSTGPVPVALSDVASGYEMGAGLLLPDGRVFQIGSTGNTAYYTPSTDSWAAGPVIPGGFVQDDAPAAELPNGKIILSADKVGYTGPTHMFEFDYTTNTYTDISSEFPTGFLSTPFGGPAFLDRMLVLPSGQVLINNSANNLVVYTPDSGALAANVPTIRSIAENANGSFTLTGTVLNGNSEGASYGDDAQMSTDYPIVSFTDAAGNVSFATTYGWTGKVAQGSTLQTTQLTLPLGLASGTYAVRVIANGAASPSYGLTIPTKLNDATPTLTNIAAATANPTFTTTSKLSVLGADTAGESTLNYTWTTTSSPAGVTQPSFSTNGTNAAKNDTATFYGVGAYTFKVTATNLAGLSISSSVTVNVDPALTTLALSPTLLQLAPNQTQQFKVASGLDQFGNQISATSLTWAVTSGAGTVTPAGLYTAPATGTIATVTVSSGTVRTSASVYVLSSPWTNTDVGGPTLAGYAGDNGSGTFTLLGSGTDISGSSDQFQYTDQTLTGNSTIIAQVGSVQNTGAVAKAGLMYRTDTTNNSAYVMLALTPSSGLVFSYRATSGAMATTIAIPRVTAPEYLKIVRIGGVFTASYSTDGVTYTQAGIATVAAIGSAADVGLVLTSNNSSKTNTSVFNHVIADATPLVVTQASASPNPVTTTSTTLSVLGGDPEGESALTYTWVTTASPAGALPPTFAINGTNAAKNDVVTFSKAGNYTFMVTLANALGYSVTSSVTLSVVSTQTTVRMTPTTVTLTEGATQQFVTAVYDQFGLKLAKQPQFTYSLVAGGIGGKVSSTGLYTAPTNRTGIDRVNVTGAGTASIATITVTGISPSLATFGVNTNAPATVGSLAVGWGGSGTTSLATASDGLRLLPAGRQADLPWANIRTLTVTLSRAEPLSPSDVRVAGLTVANYGPVTVTPVSGVSLTPGSVATTTYLVTLARPIALADRVTVTIGNSGIATYTRRIDVLPGDVNGDGVVDATDATIASGYLATTFAAADIFGEGVVTTKGVKAIQLLNGTKLPMLR